MFQAEKLYIKNFGPIKEADVSIGKITVLIGEQGSGKSTVAKLYSLFSWMEKSLMRHLLTVKYVTQYSRFKKVYCAYNNIDSYFSNDTALRFDGFHYSFLYQNDSLEISEVNRGQATFNIAKVMYVPAERNVLGSVEHPSRLKGLGDSMAAFLEEYDRAKIIFKSGYLLPFGNVEFEYDVLNDIPKLKRSDFEINLAAASSGYQSTLPLLLVSKNLSEMVQNSSLNSDLSEKERKALQKEVELIMNDTSLSEEVRKASLRTISSRYRHSRFVNIVEEMELNLFPDSQKGVLYELVSEAYTLQENRLMLTTHSPYVINYLTLAVKARQIAERATGNEKLAQRLNEVVPQKSQISTKDLAIYELASGLLKKVDNYEGLPSDNNFLNNKLNDTNLLFDTLLEIEDDLS